MTEQKLVADIYRILDNALDCDCVSWRSVAEKQEIAIIKALEMLRELQERTNDTRRENQANRRGDPQNSAGTSQR